MPIRLLLRGTLPVAVAVLMGLLSACGTDGEGAGSSSGDAALQLDLQTSLDDVEAAWDAEGTNGSSGDGTPNEAGPLDCPGGPGCECSDGKECDSGYCVPMGTKKVCTKLCTESCEPGFKCATVVGSSGDFASICITPFQRLCDPCQSSKECEAIGEVGSACVDRGADGAFCGVSCQGPQDCKAGFVCQTGKTVEGGETKQCQPVDNVCTCSDAAIAAGKSTTCTAPAGQGGGVCKGQRTCKDGGLSDCSASAASSETCDGVDNDCDGDTDEAACDDKNPCTDDLCNPSATDSAAACSHTTKSATPCNADDNACTENDKCDNGVCKPGQEKPASACDDGNPCTTDQCNPASGCVHGNNEGSPCQDENPCTSGNVCVAGKCNGGNLKECTSPGTCYVSFCSPVTGDCVIKAKTDGSLCDDGDACTEGDKCKSELCEGKAVECSDDNPCTSDGKCNKLTGCDFPPFSASKCTDSNECTVDDKCVNGKCVGLAADPSVACDDANPCTIDSCTAKTGCKHDFAADKTQCTDGDTCTDGDVCAKGVCVPGTNTCCDPVTNPCTNDGNLCNGTAVCVKKDGKSVCQVPPDSIVQCAGIAQGSCVGETCNLKTGKCEVAQEPDATACQDGNVCTVGEACQGGKCSGGILNPCNDANACTADTCDPKAGCKHLPIAAPCTDDDACTASDVCKDGLCVGKAINCGDDSNPCTDDKCDKVKGCLNEANQAPCDDGSPCTVGDACENKVCKSGVEDKSKCECNPKEGPKGCALMEDGNPCNGTLYCSPGGKCEVDPSTVVNCDSGADLPCLKNQCSPLTGKCAFTPVTDGKACDADGSACTQNDSCKSGKCLAGSTVSCSDGNPCTSDACDAIKGCNYPAISGSCEDGNACTQSDACVAGTCKPGPLKPCDDGNLCTNDTCVPSSGACQQLPNTDGCSDGNACTDKDACKAGVCGAGTPVLCNDDNPCTADTCDPTGGCKFSSTADACEDGKVCTKGDKCSAGKCLAGPLQKCDDGNPCTGDDTCKEPGGCENLPVPGLCNDGNACTKNDACSGGVCGGQATVVCDDLNPCTQNSCDAGGGCIYPANSAPCNDNDPCTANDVCANSKCQPGSQVACKDDGNPCTDEVCTPGIGCTTKLNSTPCDDKNTCTTNDTCGGGSCKPGTLKSCDDGNSCTNDSCDPQLGCQNLPNSNLCNDNDGCTIGDKCQGGSCVGGAPKNCADSNPCTVDEQCTNGSCTSKPMDCSWQSDECNNGVCQSGSGNCVKQAKSGSCNDDNPCTTGESCSGGSCQGGSTPTCNDYNACTVDKCEASAGGCTHTPVSDGTSCGGTSKCISGSCKNYTTTCSGKCGAAYDQYAPCQCNTQCASYGNCCSDYGSVCNVCSPSCGPCQKCSGGSCVADSSKDCQSCGGTSVCQSGSCVARQQFVVDGCTGTNFVPNCASGCYSCKPENGFSGTTSNSCGGLNCFNRFSGSGQNGMLVMYSKSSQTAWSEWNFPSTLKCNWLVEAYLPNGLPGTSNTCSVSASTYVTNATYNLKGTSQSASLNHATQKNGWRTLFSGNLSGATAVTLGNAGYPNGGCHFFLVDAIRVTPQ